MLQAAPIGVFNVKVSNCQALVTQFWFGYLPGCSVMSPKSEYALELSKFTPTEKGRMRKLVSDGN